jgi:hypothetical protein
MDSLTGGREGREYGYLSGYGRFMLAFLKCLYGTYDQLMLIDKNAVAALIGCFCVYC